MLVIFNANALIFFYFYTLYILSLAKVIIFSDIRKQFITFLIEILSNCHFPPVFTQNLEKCAVFMPDYSEKERSGTKLFSFYLER